MSTGARENWPPHTLCLYHRKVLDAAIFRSRHRVVGMQLIIPFERGDRGLAWAHKILIPTSLYPSIFSLASMAVGKCYTTTDTTHYSIYHAPTFHSPPRKLQGSQQLYTLAHTNANTPRKQLPRSIRTTSQPVNREAPPFLRQLVSRP